MITRYTSFQCKLYPKITTYDSYSILNLPSNKIRSTNYDNYSKKLYVDDSHVLLECDNFKELNSFINIKKLSLSKLVIQPKDKIFIDESSSFPSLLLGRLGLDIKRTTISTNADKIVVNPNINFGTSDYNIYYGGVDSTIGLWVIGNVYGNNLESSWASIKNNVKIKLNLTGKFYVTVKKSVLDLYDLSTSPNSNIIETSTLVNYIYSKLPKVSDSEFESIVSMLTAKDKESITAGYNLIQYVNISDRIPELGIALTTSGTQLLTTAAANYLYDILGVTRDILLGQQGNSFKGKLNFRISLMNNNLIPQSIKDRVLTALRRELSEQIQYQFGEQCKTLDVEFELKIIPHDTTDSNGETEDVNREVETE